MKVGDNRTIPMISTSAAKKKDGAMIISLANVSIDKAQAVEFDIEGMAAKSVSGRILSAKTVTDYNDFDHPETVKPVIFKDMKLKNNKVKVNIPSKSIVVLEVK